MKNIYTILEEMQFENLCIEKLEYIKKLEQCNRLDKELFTSVMFSVIQEFYSKILEKEL